MRKINGGLKKVFFLVLGLLVFNLFFCFLGILSADPLDNWHWRNPLPQGNALYGITYGSNTFVAVGYSGTILTSHDGTTWTVRTTGSTTQLHGVSYGNNTFVAVGDRGTILTSYDGITWTKRSSETPNQLIGISYGNNIFMIVGASGTILTSSDGISWTKQSSETSYDLLGITFGNNIFVAVGKSTSTILTSSDGIIWTARLTGFSINFTGITFGNNIFVAVGYAGNIVTSSDGITWISRGYGTTNYLNGVTYGNNSFVAVGKDGTILSSIDGITWIKRFSGTSYQINGAIYVNDAFFVVGDGGTILSSQDGIHWTRRSSGISYSISGITYGNNTFVAVGPNGMILTSPDGKTWTTWFSETSSNLLGVTFGNNTFVAVGDAGTILTSPNGIDWTKRSSGTSSSLWGVAYGNSTFLAVGYGNILTSLDGITWIVVNTSGIPLGVTGFASTYGNGNFVMVGTSWNSGQNSYVATSSNTINWIGTWGSSSWRWLKGVTYGNNTFVAVGSGLILTSSDGKTWTYTVNYELNSVTYGNNTFVAVGPNGMMLTSSDGVNWISRFSRASNGFNGMTYGKTTFVAVGEGGTILQSDSVLQTTISSKPSNPTNSTMANFIFSANDPGATFQCQLDSGDFATCASSAIYSELSDGNHNFTVKATAEGILEATPPSYTWIVDTTLPTGSIAINGGAERTNNATVTLTLDATDDNGVVQMQFSNDGINWFTPEAFATTKTWTLTTGDGTKTLYVEYLDNAGNWSDPYSSSIILDITQPVTTVTPAGGLYNASQSLTLIANEPAVIYYTLDGSKPTTDSTVFSNPVNITATTTLKYFAKDSSGNNEIVKTSIYYIDTISPTGNITINGGATRTNNPSVTLALSANDTSGVTQMQFSNDNLTWFTPESFATTKTWVLTGGDGTKTLYVEYLDNAGNWSTAFSNTIILDTTPPIGSITINEGAERTNNVAVILTLSATDTYGIAQMQVSNDNVAWSLPEPYATAKTWTLSTIDGTKTVYVKYKDNAGNWSSVYSATITLDTIPPETIITSSPTNPSNVTAPNFSFSSNETVVTFQCQLGSGNYTNCTSSVIYTGLADGTYIFSVKATDVAGNTDASPASYTWTVDTTAPTVTTFVIPAYAKSYTVNITTLTATDKIGVTGYMVTESPNAPNFADAGWSATVSASYTLTTVGSKMLHAWAKDGAGNVSVSKSATVIVDTTPPTVTDFVLPSTSNTLRVPITTFTATDDTDGSGVTGYIVTESNIAPNIGDAGWSATVPANYTFTTEGSKMLNAWAKDAAGNVSEGKSASVNIQILYGDINGDNIVDLKDALLALQVLAGSNPSGIRSDYAFSGVNVNGDNKIGLAEVIYILQILSGIR